MVSAANARLDSAPPLKLDTILKKTAKLAQQVNLKTRMEHYAVPVVLA
jgi:hypothetical protein